MGFTDPQTIHNPASGVIAPSSWGDTVRDDLVFLADRPRGTISHSTTHNVTNTSWTVAQANTETQDTDGCHSTVTNNSRVTIVTAGAYLFEALIEFGNTTSGNRAAKFLKNGTTDHMGNYVAGSFPSRPTVVAYLPGLVAGDYIEAAGFQTSGGTISMQLLRLSWVWMATS